MTLLGSVRSPAHLNIPIGSERHLPLQVTVCTKASCRRSLVDEKCILHHENTFSFEPLNPNFYIIKLGFTGVCINCLISALKHRFVVLVRNRLDEAVLINTHNLCFEQKYENYQSLSSESFMFWL